MELTRRAFVKAAAAGAALLSLGGLGKKLRRCPEECGGFHPPEVLVIEGQERRRLRPHGITFTPKEPGKIRPGMTMEVEFDLDEDPVRRPDGTPQVWGVEGWTSLGGGPREPRGLHELHLKQRVFNRNGIPFWGTRYRTTWRRGLWVEMYA